MGETVYSVEPPPYDPATHSLSAGDVVEIDGIWRQQWIIEPLWRPSAEELRARLAERLVEVEAGGTLWQCVPVSTDETARNRIAAGLAREGAGGPDRIINIVRDDGVAMVIDGEALHGINQAISDHLAQACLAYETILREIDTGIVTTMADVDRHPEWPLNPG